MTKSKAKSNRSKVQDFGRKLRVLKSEHSLRTRLINMRELGAADSQASVKPLWNGYHPILESEHSRITEEGLQGTGLERITERVEDHVDDVDWDSYWHPKVSYVAAGHFDRGRDVDHFTAFMSGVQFVSRMRGEVLGHLSNAQNGYETGRRTSARKALESAEEALGILLHARQDAFGHTNFYEMSPDHQGEFLRDLERGSSAAPDAFKEALRVTGWDPNADRPGRPEGDDYAHDDCAVGHGKQGKPAFAKARGAAVLDTKSAVSALRVSLASTLTESRADTVWKRFGLEIPR